MAQRPAKRDKVSPYRQVKGLTRGLAILWALKSHPGGAASITAISADTGLHRTTVKRILETLRRADFIRYDQAANAYAMTFRVRQLGEGFRDENPIAEIARPFLRVLTRKVIWPSDLLTLDRDQFVVRESTHSSSPLSFTSGVLGQRRPMLSTAVGRVYLAFCPEEERRALLAILGARNDIEGKRARDDAYVSALIERVRKHGYAVNERGEEGNKAGRFGAIAVPVRHEERVIACINIVFLMRAISTQQIVSRHLVDLVRTTKQIEREFARFHASLAKNAATVEQTKEPDCVAG